MLTTSPGTKVESAPSFDKKWYRVQTVLQFLLTVTIIAGLGGLFGGGILSSTTVRVGALDVTYDRFARRTVPIRIIVRSPEAIASPLRLTIGRQLVEKAAVISTIPNAVVSKNSLSGTEFTFVGGLDGPMEVAFSVKPDSFGVFRWTLKAADFGEVSLFQIIYP